MLEMSQVLECKQLRAQGRSIRAIAKSLGVSRNTVRGYLLGERRPGEYCLVDGRASPVSALIAPRVRGKQIARARGGDAAQATADGGADRPAAVGGRPGGRREHAALGGAPCALGRARSAAARLRAARVRTGARTPTWTSSRAIVLVHDRHPAHTAASTRRYLKECGRKLVAHELPPTLPN